MHNVDYRAGSTKKYLRNLTGVGLLLLAVLFFCGCRCKCNDCCALLDNTAVEYAHINAEAQKAPVVGQKNGGFSLGRSSNLAEPMVQLTSAELVQKSGDYQDYPNGGRAENAVGFTPQGKTKWETVKLDLLELPQVTWKNTEAVVKKPENLLILGVAGGFSIWGEFDFDEDVDRELRGREIINDDWTHATQTVGNPGTHFALAAAIYAHGLLSENNASYDFGKTLTHALVLNGLATVGLQLAAHNQAPNGQYFGWPSGHTSSSMTVASVVHEYYGLLPAAPLYALTGLVMYERMITGQHWASDVIFGAALGYVVGHTVAGEHRIQVFGMDVIPYNDPYMGSSGIGLVKTW